MSISVKKFVDIDIQHHVTSSINSIRDTAVLITTEGSSATSETYESLKEFTDAHETYLQDFPKAYAYAKVFFENAGQKLRVIEAVEDTAIALDEIIDAIPNEQIVVGYTGTQANIISVANTRAQDSSIYGVNRKLLLASVSTTTDETIIDDIIYKYSEHAEDVMTIAAYLTNINIYGVNTVQDYCFTQEQVSTIVISSGTETKVEPSLVSDDGTFDALTLNNINFDIYLSGHIRNYGGNTKSGKDLVNEFMLIVMQQTVTDAVILALTSKLKNEEGLATIKTVMSNELSKYVTNGYLNTSAVWTDPDYTVSYNSKTYTVVEQDTALPLGYRIKILPYTSLTSEDKQARKTPPIYIAVSDSYGIRKVTINGQVF